VPAPFCHRCAEPIDSEARERLCAECAAGQRYHFGSARAAGLYDGSLRQAVLRCKYARRRALAAPLGQYLAEYLATGPFGPLEPDCLVPVPLHPRRLRQRGFNQAALIAGEVSHRHGVPLHDALRRSRYTSAQARLTSAERARNILGAFAVADAASVTGAAVLLVDDVLTTCATTDECARVLMDAGARSVHVLTLARGL
jgi:ComF family protein